MGRRARSGVHGNPLERRILRWLCSVADRVAGGRAAEIQSACTDGDVWAVLRHTVGATDLADMFAHLL